MKKKFIKKIITLDEVSEVIHSLNILNRDNYLDFKTLLTNKLSEEYN